GFPTVMNTAPQSCPGGYASFIAASSWLTQLVRCSDVSTPISKPRPSRTPARTSRSLGACAQPTDTHANARSKQKPGGLIECTLYQGTRRACGRAVRLICSTLPILNLCDEEVSTERVIISPQNECECRYDAIELFVRQ